MPRIGELLVAEGVLSDVAVQSALGFQRHTGEPFRLGTILLDRDLLGEESLMKALSAIHRCDYVSWSEILQTPPRVVRLLSERAAVRLGAVPYALEGRGLRVAFKNPSNLAAVDEVSAVTNRPVIPAVISEVRLVQALHLFYGRPVPIEFRNVLLKLERNEERRLYRTRATMRAPIDPFAEHVPLAQESVRRIPIASEDPPKPREAPLQYTAPFASAELAHGELAEAADFLPGYAPPRSLTPEEMVARMWTEVTSASAVEVYEAKKAGALRPQTSAEAPAARRPARNQAAEALLDSLAQRFPRVLLLASAQDSVQGWAGRGGGITGDAVAGVRIPWGEPSIFAFVKLSGSPHRGALSRILLPPVLSEMLGPKAIACCAVFPVRIKDRVIAFLYADRAGAPLSEEDYRELEIASSSLGSSLARLLMELRKSVPTA
ncbi:MAG: hypothetical protein ABI968_02720 [Acidobacteriota bacterium]